MSTFWGWRWTMNELNWPQGGASDAASDVLHAQVLPTMGPALDRSAENPIPSLSAAVVALGITYWLIRDRDPSRAGAPPG